MDLLSFISLVGWSLFLSLQFKRYASVFPLLVASGIIAWLYIFGFVHLLSFGSYLLFATGLGAPFYYFLSNSSLWQRSALTKELKSLPISFYILSLGGLFWYFFTLHASLFNWDEFFWAPFTRVMASTHAFYTKTSPILDYKINYPPGPALFQYFFVQFKNYSEPGLYFAQGILVLASLAPIFDLAKRNVSRLILVGLASLIALVYFGPGFLSLYNDQILGVIFASSILASLYYLPTLKSKLLLIPSLAALPLIKNTGVILSAVIVLAVIIEFWFTRKEVAQKTLALWQKALIILALLLTPLVAMKSWDSYLKTQQIASNSGLVKPSQVIKAFSKDNSPKDQQIISNFKRFVLEDPINFQIDPKVFTGPYLKDLFILKLQHPALSTFAWSFYVLFIFLALTYLSEGKVRSRYITAFVSLTIGGVLYLFFHLVLYLTIFSPFEASGLASASRYISSYLLGVALVLIGAISYFFDQVSPDKHKMIRPLLYFIAIGLLLFNTPPLYRYFASPTLMAKSTTEARTKTRFFSNEINALTPENSKVWLIYDNTDGWESMLIRYDIMPRRMNGWDWSLSAAAPPAADVWTSQKSPTQWQQDMIDQNYDYIYLAKLSDTFWQDYGSLFDDLETAKTKQLFGIQKNAGRVKLVGLD